MTRLLADEGETVDVGVPIIAIDVAACPIVRTMTASRSATEPAGRRETPSRARRPGPMCRERQAVLVGYGVKTSATKRRARKTAAGDRRGRGAPGNRGGTHRTAVAGPGGVRRAGGAAARALAKPPVRKLAKDLGVSLAELAGSGPAARLPGTTCSGRPVYQPVRPVSGVRTAPGPADRTARADPGPGRAQAHGRGHGGERVHRTARHRVPAGRRDRDDGGAAAGARPARIRRAPGVAAAVRGPGAARRGGQAPADQLLLGRRRGGDRGQALREPRHRGRRRARAHRAEHQGRRRADAARAGPGACRR